MANPDLEPPGGVLGDDDGDYGDLAPEPSMMDADHPLLARAQAALKSQLEAAKYAVDTELREKAEALRVRAAAPCPPSPPPLPRAAPTPVRTARGPPAPPPPPGPVPAGGDAAGWPAPITREPPPTTAWLGAAQGVGPPGGSGGTRACRGPRGAAPAASAAGTAGRHSRPRARRGRRGLEGGALTP